MNKWIIYHTQRNYEGHFFKNSTFIINIISSVTIPIAVFLQNYDYWITTKFVSWIPAAEFMFLITIWEGEEDCLIFKP